MWDELVCPIDQGPVVDTDGWLVCKDCGRGYPVLDDLPTFLPVEEDPRWRQSLERQLVHSSKSSPIAGRQTSQLRRRARALENWLAGHLHLASEDRILQIGLEGEGEAHHFRQGIAYGVDPLAGAMASQGRLKWGRMRWISGRGEELPFPARHFRLMLLIDALAHVESPQQVLNEVGRCLSSDGMAFLTMQIPNEESMALHQLTPRKLLQACRASGLRRMWHGPTSEFWKDCQSGDDHSTTWSLLLAPVVSHQDEVPLRADADPALAGS